MRLAHRLYMLGCSGAGAPDFPSEYLALLRGVAPHCMNDWAFLAEYAFAHHETGQLDDAMRYAQTSLDINPTNAVACHSMTHVHFEQGDAATGEDFLGGWLLGFDSPASSYVHLSWHLALFELALGKYRETLDRYENFIRPSVVSKAMATLNDSASLMWRLQIYGGVPPAKPWDEVLVLAVPAADRAGAAFRDAHAALAFAGSGEHELMARMIDRLRKIADGGDSFTKDIVLPLDRRPSPKKTTPARCVSWSLCSLNWCASAAATLNARYLKIPCSKHISVPKNGRRPRKCCGVG